MFVDRRDAGRKLAEQLGHYAQQTDVVVFGIPRGGVPVAAEVARALDARLGVLIVRKIGVPGHAELAMGAIASGGACYLNEQLIRRLRVPLTEVEAVIEMEKRELARREQAYPPGVCPSSLKNFRVILVDDGLATGASMFAGIQALRGRHPKELIAAVPVMAASSIPEVQSWVDALVYVLAPDGFYSVGQWYQEFGETTDEEVREALSSADRVATEEP